MSCLLLKWHRGGLSSAKGELGGASAVEVSTFLQGYCNQKVVEQAKKKGYEKPLLFKVPKNDLPFVGFT